MKGHLQPSSAKLVDGSWNAVVEAECGPPWGMVMHGLKAVKFFLD